jgi:hypothetical protein
MRWIWTWYLDDSTRARIRQSQGLHFLHTDTGDSWNWLINNTKGFLATEESYPYIGEKNGK